MACGPSTYTFPAGTLESRQKSLYILHENPEVNVRYLFHAICLFSGFDIFSCNLLHPTKRIISYYDHVGCTFLSLCSNHAAFSARHLWPSRRGLKRRMQVYSFNEAEEAQAKWAYQWHIIDTACYEVLPEWQGFRRWYTAKYLVLT